jgi:hypothetical protein
VEYFGFLGANVQTMAEYFGVSHATMDRRLEEPEIRAAYDKGFSRLKIELLAAQKRCIDTGNVAMMIWLGKQYLNQHEPRPQDNDKPQELQQPNQIPEHVMLDTLSRALKPKGYTVVKLVQDDEKVQ